MFFLEKYEDIYNEMLVTYKPVETDPDDDDISGDDPVIIIIGDKPPIKDPDEIPNDNPEDTPVIPDPEPVPEPAPVPEPEPEPEPVPEVLPEIEIVKNEPVATIPPTPKVSEQKKVESGTFIKSEDTNIPKRIEATIIGEVLNHKVTATVPAGVDERSVSRLQKQISDTIDGLIQEITDNQDSVKERVSAETLDKIEKAISEGKEISAETNFLKKALTNPLAPFLPSFLVSSTALSTIK